MQPQLSIKKCVIGKEVVAPIQVQSMVCVMSLVYMCTILALTRINHLFPSL